MEAGNHEGESSMAKLLHAMIQNNTNDVSEILSQEDLDLKQTDFLERNLLHIACTFNSPIVIPFFISDPRCTPDILNNKDSSGYTPLMTAVIHGNLECIQQLEHGKGLEFRENTEMLVELAMVHEHRHIVDYLDVKIQLDSLEEACQTSNNKLVKQIILSRPEMVNSSLQGLTPLHIAMSTDDTDLLNTLLESPLIRLDHRSQVDEERGGTPLHSACRYNSYSVIKIFVMDKRCSEDILTIKDYNEDTPLMLAVRKGHLEALIELELERFPISNSDILLEIAIFNNQYMIIEYLLNRKQANLEQLHEACILGNKEILKQVLTKEHEAFVNSHFEDGLTPLHVVMMSNHIEFLSSLLSLPAIKLDVLSQSAGSTPLHVACEYDNWMLMPYLLDDERFDDKVLNIQDKNGNTALIVAVKMGHIKCVHQLSDMKGINFGVKNLDNETAMDIASKYKDQIIIESLTNFHIKNVQPKRTFDESDVLDMEYKIVEGHFQRLASWYQKRLVIQSIDIVFNRVLKAKFEAKQADLRAKGCGECYLFFHGTPEKNIPSILRNNFDLSIVENGRAHGNGVYFSERPNVSLGYCTDQKKLLLCKVLMGDNSTEVKKGNRNDPRCWAVVVPDVDQILPKYIINFATA